MVQEVDATEHCLARRFLSANHQHCGGDVVGDQQGVADDIDRGGVHHDPVELFQGRGNQILKLPLRQQIRKVGRRRASRNPEEMLLPFLGAHQFRQVLAPEQVLGNTGQFLPGDGSEVARNTGTTQIGVD